MDRLQRWRDSLTWFVAAVSVAFSYELRNAGVIGLPETGLPFVDRVLPATAAAVVLLASLPIAKLLSRRMIASSRIRAVIMGENYVEGFWHIRTDPPADGESDSPLSPDGVLWLRFEPAECQYSVTTTRLSSAGVPYHVPSKLINMRIDGQLLLYVNYFIISNEGSHSTEGVSIGHFIKQPSGSKTKNRVDAFVFTQGEGARHQWAEPISEAEVAKYRDGEDEGGETWMTKFLVAQQRTPACTKD